MAPPPALAEFIAEATEVLDALERDVHVLDVNRGREPEPELLNAIFRRSHSLKGLAAMFGLEHVSRLAHHAEDVFDALRLGRLTLNDALLDTLIEVLDALQALLVEATEATPGEAEGRAEGLGVRLTALVKFGRAPVLEGEDESGLGPAVLGVLTEFEEHRLRENLRRGARLWRVRAAFGINDFDLGLATLTAALRPLGEVISTLPSSEPADGPNIGFDLIVGSGQSLEALVSAAGASATVSLVGPRAGPVPSSAALPPSRPLGGAPRLVLAGSDGQPEPPPASAPIPTAPRGDPSLRSLTHTVRVDIGRLDALMNAIGELLLIRGNLARLAEGVLAPGAAPPPKLFLQALQREVRGLTRRLDDLQKGLLEVRMVPLGQVFDKLTRLMRRLVRESGKDVAFEVVGGDVELDKLILEELSDPLMHLLRNALDHGVEDPAGRAARGKLPTGLIRLQAQQHGNHVVIRVGDDGAGMDEARIRQVAIERGLVGEEALERRDLLNLVFLPGFSTRREVSALSGRGVGLDVVKTNLARLSGRIDIESTAGNGTTFELTLPATLAIIRALMVSATDRVYAIPLNAVTEILAVQEGQLRTIERREVLEVRGQTLPFVRLSSYFGLPETRPGRLFVVILGLAQVRVCVAVDALMGQHDIVTKPLGGRLRGLRGVSGATELGDRRVVLVLDVAALVDEVVRAPAAVG